MRNFNSTLPLSLYVHIPWCLRKCPYCDFNSHANTEKLPELAYIQALFSDLEQALPQLQGRTITSIFFGGGTPSLFSAKSIAAILTGIKERIAIAPSAEITLEANPGTLDEANFAGFFAAGVNRLSLGIQSLNDQKLALLGRIHNSENALLAIEVAKKAGFENFNLDMMYGLPNQTINEALADLEKALSFSPNHLSWYQLTIEPNTFFYRHPPQLPVDENIWQMQQQGQALLKQYGLNQYEVSAYSLPQKACAHNRNYWEFGDYLGIGAGAHSKITDLTTKIVSRFYQIKLPRDYLNKDKQRRMGLKELNNKELIFEFMLNALRLSEGVPFSLFTERTGLPIGLIEPTVSQAQEKGLLQNSTTQLCPTELGKRFLNDLTMLFL